MLLKVYFLRYPVIYAHLFGGVFGDAVDMILFFAILVFVLRFLGLLRKYFQSVT